MSLQEVAILAGVICIFGKAVLDEIRDRRNRANAKNQNDSLAQIKKTGEDTHTLSNSAMGVILKISAGKSKQIYMLLKKLAEVTNEPGYIASVEVAQAEWISAERAAGKHEGQQQVVDQSVAPVIPTEGK